MFFLFVFFVIVFDLVFANDKFAYDDKFVSRFCYLPRNLG